jgi:ABC-type multidrug transport system fused ATPase/permease subunit
VKEEAFDWATTPRKNLNLGMTIGDATYRINDSVADVEWIISSYFDTILPAVFSSVASAIYIITMEIWAIPVLAVGLILTVVTFLVRQKIEAPVTIKMEHSGSKVSNFLVNTLANLTLINLFKSQSMEMENLGKRTGEYLHNSKKRYMIWCVYWSVMVVIDALCTYGIVMISSTKALSGVVSASSIVLIISYVGKVFSPIQDFG